MALNIHFHDEVWTKDDKKLGVADRIVHRPEGGDPSLKYYGSYLHVEDYHLGLTYYIPTDFIAEVDHDQHRVLLTTTQRQVLHNTWDRTPEFVLAGRAETQKLEPVPA